MKRTIPIFLFILTVISTAFPTSVHAVDRKTLTYTIYGLESGSSITVLVVSDHTKDIFKDETMTVQAGGNKTLTVSSKTYLKNSSGSTYLYDSGQGNGMENNLNNVRPLDEINYGNYIQVYNGAGFAYSSLTPNWTPNT